MKFGHFDDSSREYVIETPRTPYPWINYLGAEDFFSLISNSAGGYSFYKDARYRRLTRYRYNSVPADAGGRYFYIRDGDVVWSPGWKPVKAELDRYECRHGMGYSTISGEKNGVSVETLFFVPLGHSCELQRVRITNGSSVQKSLRLFSFVEFCFWDALDDMTNFQRNLNIGEVEIEGSVIYHKSGYRERRNHFAFYGVNCETAGYDTDREQFMGLYNGFERPDAVFDGAPKNSVAHGWSPIASHCIDVELAAGETRDYVFVLGYAENTPEQKWESPGVLNKAPARRILEAFSTTEQVDAALDRLKAYWDELLSAFTVRSGDERVDRSVNIWNQYQCMVTFNLARSASYFESGIGRGIGFRDTSQDLLGVVHQVPERARQRIIDTASTQFEDGGAYHQYQPLTKRGNDAVGGDFNDDPLWLILSSCAYVKESGDWSILEEPVPFDHDAAKARPLFEHLRRSFDHVLDNLGPHGLPLIGRADWNDCLNLNCFSTNPDESFQTAAGKDGRTAESVMIAGMFVYIGEQYAELCEQLGRDEEAKRAYRETGEMRKRVERDGWDGEWYVRAYDDFGNKVGSREQEEAKIFIESQGFCSMAGIGAEEEMPRRALDSVSRHLDTAYGIVLLSPAFREYRLHLGEVSSYPPGYKENGGVFCHNNPWVMIGETVLGCGARAFDYYRKLAPGYVEEWSDVHRTEPYVYSQMVAGKEASRQGEAKNSWLTGTAAWNWVAVTQHILGIRPGYDGLRIDPCIPPEWPGFSCFRRFRGATYDIRVENPDGVGSGVSGMEVDGQHLAGHVAPLFADGKRHSVTVILGSGGR